MNIEETILTSSLPVNSKAMLARLTELMDEHGTNCLADCKYGSEVDDRIKAVLWLLNSQVFGQLAIIDQHQLWCELNKQAG